MAPAARSPIFRNDIRPDDLPPPDSLSPEPRMLEKFEPVPEPYLKRRASRIQRSMMPPSLTSSSDTPCMKQACGCGRSYADSEGCEVPSRWSTYQWPWPG